MSSDNISENIEEYLEVLYRNGSNKEQVSTTKLSKELKIAPGSVTQMLKKLEKLGYIEYKPYKGASLTDEGMRIAQNITRKHRILEKFLTDVLNIQKENVHEQACQMEHTLSDEAERALCLMLNSPDLCPDEKVIPSCNFEFQNCEECFNEKDFNEVNSRKNNLLSLSEINTTGEGLVLFIRGDEDLYNEAKEFGITIGTNISFIKKSESNKINLIIDNEEIDVPLELANNIFVKF